MTRVPFATTPRPRIGVVSKTSRRALPFNKPFSLASSKLRSSQSMSGNQRNNRLDSSSPQAARSQRTGRSCLNNMLYTVGITPGKRFPQLRNAPDHAWRQDSSCEIVRDACQYPGDTHAAFRDPDPSGPRASAIPGQALHTTCLHHPVPRAHPGQESVQPQDGLDVSRSHPSACRRPAADRARPAGVRRQAAEGACLHRVPGAGSPPDACRPAESGAVGVDRNAGQATDSTGAVHALPDTTVEDAQSKRYQRRMFRQQKGSHRRRGTAGPLRKLHRQRARCRDTAIHPIRRNAAGHRPHGRHGRPEHHQGHNAECAGHGREARPEHAAEGRPQPCHPGVRPGTAGVQARVQGRPGDVCGPGPHCAGLQPVRMHCPVKPTVAGGVPARGTGAAARRGALPPRATARPTPGTPATREPDRRDVNPRMQGPMGMQRRPVTTG